MHAVPRALDQSSDFILTEHVRQNAGLLGKGEIIKREVAPLQCPLVEKPQGRHTVLDTTWRQLLLMQRVDLITADLFGNHC